MEAHWLSLAAGAALDVVRTIGETAARMLLLAITRHAGTRIAELGFLLVAIAGAIMVIGAIVPSGRRVGTALSGIGLGAGAVLLIVATHWGHFGTGPSSSP